MLRHGECAQRTGRRENGYTFVYPQVTLARQMGLKTKNVGMRLRLERELRQEFLEMCRADGQPAAQVLRAFMRDYVQRKRGAVQGELFGTSDSGEDWFGKARNN